MKKIIFIAQSLRIGGAQRALINQLNNLDKHKFEVSLFLYSQSGEYLNYLDDSIRVIKSNFILNCVGKTSKESKANIICFIVRNGLALIAKVFGSQKVFSVIFKYCKKIEGYDYAVSYLHNIAKDSLYFGYNKYILENIIASKKIAWIHSDYEIAKLNTDYNNNEYKSMDYVINVSNSMKEKFDSIVKLEKNKSRVIYNTLPIQEILNMSKAYNTQLEKDNFNIVTLCRMDSNKSVMELCEIAKYLFDSGSKFKWHFIGEGPLFKLCYEFTQKNNLEDVIMFHGFVANPYPIIKHSNLLVSGSKSETFGMSIAESLILNTPVVALYYPAIVEVLNDKNGIIVTNLNEISITIKNLIRDKAYYEKLKANTKLFKDYNSENELMIDEIFE